MKQTTDHDKLKEAALAAKNAIRSMINYGQWYAPEEVLRKLEIALEGPTKKIAVPALSLDQLDYIVLLIQNPEKSLADLLDLLKIHDSSPSTNWEHGGPILQKLVKDGYLIRKSDLELCGPFRASYDNGASWVYGHTLLVAVMSAMAKEEFGQFVDIPQELVCIKSS